MAYKIAVASSDGVQIDQTFGAAEAFLIYEIDGERQTLAQTRELPPAEEVENCGDGSGCASGCGEGAQNGCGEGAQGGCGAGASGCGGGGNAHSAKTALLSDCRCVVCTRVGHPVRKELEKMAISVFDVDCTVEEALRKITAYYARVDRHESLRNFS